MRRGAVEPVQKFPTSLKPEQSKPKEKLPYRYTTCRFCGDVVAYCSCLVEDLVDGGQKAKGSAAEG